MTNEKDRFGLNCPGCEFELTLVPRMKVVKTNEETLGKLELAEKEGHLLSPECGCPNCGHVVQVRYQVTLLGVIDLGKKVKRPEPSPVPTVLKLPSTTVKVEPHPNNWTATKLNSAEVAFVEQCEANGLLSALTQVVKDQTNVLNRPPNDMGKFLITLLRTAVLEKKLPPPILHEFVREFPGRIQFWKAQGIGIVTSNGKICRFVPMRSMNLDRSAKTRGRLLELNGMGDHRVESFDYISRTQHGYVPEGARIFLESLRHSLGDRGRKMKDIPLQPNVSK